MKRTISVMTPQKWFRKDEGTSIDDESRLGRQVTITSDVLKSLVVSKPQLTVNQIAEMMDLSHGTVSRHLKEIEYFPDTWKVGTASTIQS